MEMSIDSFDIKANFGRNSSVNNLTKVIMGSLLIYNGLSDFPLASKLVCFGIDGLITFQGSKISVIVQLKENHAPLMLGVHYVAHQINLVV
jgi:hypothetical protein